MHSKSEQDILKVLKYFSYFGYPLTAFEIYKWQFNSSYDFDQILSVLDSSQLQGKQLASKNGFYCLGSEVDLEDQLKNRHDRYLNAVKKYKKLNRVVQYLARLPFVKGVAVCNSLAYHFTEERSDIDLFIITQKGKVWTTRLFAVLPMMLLKQRPGEAKRDPVDMSFFVAEDALDISEFKLKGGDPYMAYWIKNLLPVYGSDRIWQDWFRANRVNELKVAHAKRASLVLRCKVKRSLPINFREAMAKKLQQRKLPLTIKAMQNIDSRVVVTDRVLKFHKNDRRGEIREVLERA